MGTINTDSRTELEGLGFDDIIVDGKTVLDRIESIPAFVDAINTFHTNGGAFKDGGTGIQLLGNSICIDSHSDYCTFSYLAHELGHYFGNYQDLNIYKYNTARSYANAMIKAEAGAMYYEYSMLRYEKIATGNNVDTTMTGDSLEPGGLYQYISVNSLSLDVFWNNKQKDIGNAVPSTESVDFTYYERAVWDFFNERTYLSENYEEIFDRPLTEKSDYALIQKMIDYNLFGTDRDLPGNDIITAVGAKSRRDETKALDNTLTLIWGGVGDDKISGWVEDDIILGGSGNDMMSGNQGNDVLAGNEGIDFMYGGEDFDTYYADNQDIIMDDYKGEGAVLLNKELLTGGTRKKTDPVNTYKGKDGTLYILSGTTLTVNNGLVIKDYHNGQLGIRLEDEEEIPDEISQLLKIASTIPSPIVLDLNGDGVTTTALTSGAYFDHAGDGFAEQTAWVSPEDGLLVRDLNHNGTIDTGAELFGNNTKLANGQKAANGFLALADLDTNKDGKINASDAAFGDLQVWKDTNGDGITSTGELHSLTELGIVSISTAYTASSTVDANGNSHSQTGTYTTTDGQTRAATDVWFKTDSLHSVATEILEVPENTLNLPEISGYGHVRSLQQAMA